jgi:hypothetical protein
MLASNRLDGPKSIERSALHDLMQLTKMADSPRTHDPIEN